MGFASKCGIFKLPGFGVKIYKFKIFDKRFISFDHVTYGKSMSMLVAETYNCVWSYKIKDLTKLVI